MSPPVFHTGLGSLPMGIEEAVLTLGVGLVVLLVVAYDLYRNRWSGGF